MSKNKLNTLITQLSAGPDNAPFDLKAFLKEGQSETPTTVSYMDKEEALIRLLCEISAEFPAESKDNLK